MYIERIFPSNLKFPACQTRVGNLYCAQFNVTALILKVILAFAICENSVRLLS